MPITCDNCQRIVTPRSLDIQHQRKGGTGITSFHEADLPAMTKTVQKFGCPFIRIHPTPLAVDGSRAHVDGEYSLHDLLRRSNMKAFWALFEKVQEEI